MKYLLLILSALLLSLQLNSQTRVIRGELTAFNKFPVANVEVTAKKAKTSVTTNDAGEFQIVCKEKDVIIIKSEVFTSMNKRIGSKDEYLNLNLIFKDTPSNREVATGMGYLKEDQLTYALSNLESENNDFCNYTDVISLIRGKFSGVEVSNNGSGGVGVYIRGSKTLEGSNEALYVVDGMEVVDISFVVPCDMTSINILKDGAAAMYGSRAANGVVVIETKGYTNR